MPQHIPLSIRGHTIDVYLYIRPASPTEESDLAAKVRGLERLFLRMPQRHVTTLYPIFFIEEKPGRGEGGGTWRHAEVGSGFMGHVDRTNVPDDDVRRLVVDRGTGMIGIPRNRWPRPLNRLMFTVFHEAGHAVDYSLNITPSGATIQDFAGVAPACGAGNAVKKRAVEAYARWMLIPGRVCGELSGAEQQAANQRVIGVLRRSPAFGSISGSWRPGSGP